MCGMCPDVIGSCDQESCGAMPRLREDGTRRSSYMRHYIAGEVPCGHVLAKHQSGCAVSRGGFCDDCWDEL